MKGLLALSGFAAMALMALPQERKRDMTKVYAASAK
jgi:hypothetical protein